MMLAYSVFFFLNYLTLSPNQAIFLEANEPHAYISGDCIECMATSDNVVRAGLTPKFKDTDTLIKMLTYESKNITKQLMFGTPIPNRPYSRLYDPPIPEFAVISINITQCNVSEVVGGTKGPGILLITNASNNACMVKEDSTTLSLCKGLIYFIPPNVTFTILSGTTSGTFQAYFAFCEVGVSV